MHGVVDDVYLIAKGFSAAAYTAFSVIHIIIVTGVMFARQAFPEMMIEVEATAVA